MIDRNEALRLLKGGPGSVEEWNQRRTAGETIPALSGIDLSEANLSDAWLYKADLRSAKLAKAKMSKAILYQSELSDAELWGADLSGSDLLCANLSGANLLSANLTRANLSRADLSDSKLSRADLSEADLSSANLTGADLSQAELTGAKSDSTFWGNVDLSKVKGIEFLRHFGPSTLGIDTIIISRGKIPRVFLKGCGVPDSFIDYIPSLIDSLSPIQFYSCFISYSHKNEDFAQRLHGRLEQAGLRVWYAPEDMRGGRKSHEQIDEAIRFHDKLLLVLSEKSMASEWVATEIRKARKRETTEGCQVLFPIRLVSIGAIREWECFDADIGKDMAVEIREYHIPDFSNWKDHDAFEAGFARLLEDLRAGAE